MATVRVTDKINIDGLCKLLRLTPIDEIIEQYDSSGDTAYTSVYREAIRSGASESAAEKLAEKAESEERDEYYHKMYDAVMSVAGKIFDEHHLVLKAAARGKRPYDFRVVPLYSWKDSAQKIVETINGVGEFHFHSVKDFLTSGPYTEREGVLSHLHWMADWPRVYGSGTTRSMFERAAR